MALLEGQFSVRGLVMGTGTQFQMLNGEFNPWNRNVRSPATGERAWNHGSWSGAEWAESVVVPIRLLVGTPGGSHGGWLDAHQQLTAAFAPSHTTQELRFRVGGREYVMFGRPRMVEPDVATIDSGVVPTSVAFEALDPLIYSGFESSTGQFGLPIAEGGLTVPFEVPFIIDAEVDNGARRLRNEGTAETGIRFRVDGPVDGPRVSLVRPDGLVQIWQYMQSIPAGQWLDVDTANRTVLLNGMSSRRGRMSGVFPVLPPGESDIRFAASGEFPDATVNVRWRSAWW